MEGRGAGKVSVWGMLLNLSLSLWLFFSIVVDQDKVLRIGCQICNEIFVTTSNSLLLLKDILTNPLRLVTVVI